MKSRWLALPWFLVDVAYAIAALFALSYAYLMKIGGREFAKSVETDFEFNNGETIRKDLSKFLQGDGLTATGFPGFNAQSGVQDNFLRSGAVFVCISWLRVIKYLADVNSDIGVIWDTIRRATTAILFFIMIFMLMLLGFASWGSAYFGVRIRGFIRFNEAVRTCLYFTFG